MPTKSRPRGQGVTVLYPHFVCTPALNREIAGLLGRLKNNRPPSLTGPQKETVEGEVKYCAAYYSSVRNQPRTAHIRAELEPIHDIAKRLAKLLGGNAYPHLTRPLARSREPLPWCVKLSLPAEQILHSGDGSLEINKLRDQLRELVALTNGWLAKNNKKGHGFEWKKEQPHLQAFLSGRWGRAWEENAADPVKDDPRARAKFIKRMRQICIEHSQHCFLGA